MLRNGNVLILKGELKIEEQDGGSILFSMQRGKVAIIILSILTVMVKRRLITL